MGCFLARSLRRRQVGSDNAGHEFPRPGSHHRRSFRLRQGHHQSPRRHRGWAGTTSIPARCTAPWAIAAGWSDLDLSDASALVRCTFDTEVGFRDDGDGEPRVIVNGVDATVELRTETAGAAASAIAAIPEVRSALKERQRAFRRPPGLVADGRDMGTVIFPDAAHQGVSDRQRRGAGGKAL